MDFITFSVGIAAGWLVHSTFRKGSPVANATFTLVALLAAGSLVAVVLSDAAMWIYVTGFAVGFFGYLAYAAYKDPYDTMRWM